MTHMQIMRMHRQKRSTLTRRIKSTAHDQYKSVADELAAHSDDAKRSWISVNTQSQPNDQHTGHLQCWQHQRSGRLFVVRSQQSVQRAGESGVRMSGSATEPRNVWHQPADFRGLHD